MKARDTKGPLEASPAMLVVAIVLFAVALGVLYFSWLASKDNRPAPPPSIERPISPAADNRSSPIPG